MHNTPKLLALTFTLCLLVAPLLAFSQHPEAELMESMPEDEGRELVTSLCVGCHSLATVLSTGKGEEGWRDTINNMISRGAQIFDDETETILGYLTRHYGAETGPASSSLDPPAPVTVKESSESVAMQNVGDSADHPGQAVLAAKCGQCHGPGTWQDLRLDRSGWEVVLYSMVGRGALWTEEEIHGMAEYLAQDYGPESATQRRQ